MKFIPHPATQIAIWVLLALLVQRLQPLILLGSGAALAMGALKLSRAQILSLLRRTRWILFSLLLIYAFTTPGSAVWGQLGGLSPTHEGLLEGMLQLGRLLCVLCGLAILLELLTRNQLISGLYTLAYPLRWFGLSRERIAVRLALTLEYAESAMGDTARDWRATIDNALRPTAKGTSHIELQVTPFGTIDLVLCVALLVVLAGAW